MALRDSIERTVMAAGSRLPRMLKRAVAGRLPAIDGRVLDVDYAMGLRMLELGGATDYTQLSLE